MIDSAIWVLFSEGPSDDDVYGSVSGVFLSKEGALRHLEHVDIGTERFERLLWLQSPYNENSYEAYDPEDPDDRIVLASYELHESNFGHGYEGRPTEIPPDRLFRNAQAWYDAGKLAVEQP